jgi:hypothetical protein
MTGFKTVLAMMLAVWTLPLSAEPFVRITVS